MAKYPRSVLTSKQVAAVKKGAVRLGKATWHLRDFVPYLAAEVGATSSVHTLRCVTQRPCAALGNAAGAAYGQAHVEAFMTMHAEAGRLACGQGPVQSISGLY